MAHLVDPQRARELDLDTLGQEAVAACLAMFRATLERFGVRFDVWFSERTLHEGAPTAVDRELADLQERGESYRSEGALWLRTTAHGDDKDRVLERSSGEHTYFASDVAYHRDKLARGFERLIDVWGADHHGYIARMKAALAAIGADPDRLELIILQFVHLVEGGGRASMSKRRGEFVTLDDLISEIGSDAARYFLLARSADTTVDLDLDLARAESADNPVYYVQYAHARIVSVLDKAGTDARGRGPGRPAHGAARRVGTASRCRRSRRSSARSSSPSSRFPKRWPSPRPAGRPIASPPTRSHWRRTSPPSIATAGSSAPSRPAWSPSASPSRSPPATRSPRRCRCSGSARHSTCEAPVRPARDQPW